jgi:UDP-glucose 4-epimerase
MGEVLVTGGAGYIGSVVCRTLLERGHRVVVVDSLLEGHRSAVPRGAFFYQGEMGDPVLLGKIFDNHAIDGVVHLAAFCLVGESVADPEKYFSNNVVQGLSLLRAMRARGVRRIIFSSTAAVYGEPQGSPITEEHPTAPINPYGLSKLIFEQALETYRQAYGLQYVTFRYFNAAGAAADCGEDHHPETHLIPLILKQAVRLQRGQPGLSEEGLAVYGGDYPTPDGSCLRDYIHIRDLALAHVLALEKLDRLPVHIFNLGNGQGFSVLEVIRKAAEVTGVDIPYTVGPRRAGDPAALVASSDRARRYLGWEPQFPHLGDIIRSAWEWHRGHPEGYGDQE